MRRAVVLGTLCIISLAPAIGAQATQRTRLTDFQGVYAYHGKTNLAIVAGDSIVFAIIDDAKYPLRPLGADRFLNAGGDTIPFRRGADGVVSGFVERGVFFPRQSAAVDALMTASVRSVPRTATSYVYRAPTDGGDGLRVGNITDVGFDSASVIRLINRVIDGSYPDVHSLLVYRGGRLVVEEYFYGYDRNRWHQMRSATKSVVSALVGIAIDRGALSGDGELVTKRLPYASYANADARKDQLTIRDLLTMRSGLACDDWSAASPGNESRMYEANDWVKFVLDLQMTDQPGTVGRYCSGNVAVAGRMVERATSKSLPVFAQENLFTPLGIRAGDVRWNYTLSAENAGTFAQLYMRPRDMLKLGMLFQQQGRWNGRQVISSEWVAKSTARWSTVGDSEYGYFWWHQWTNAATSDGPRRLDMIVATGNGGQKIYMVPSLDLIVVLTGGNFNTNSPAMTIMAKDLLPALLNRTSK